METPPYNVQDLQNLLVTPWYQKPLHTFRTLVLRTQNSLAAQGGPTQYWSGDPYGLLVYYSFPFSISCM